MTDRQWLEIGTIVSTQGLQGEVRVYPNSDFPTRFQKAGKRWIQNPQTQEVTEIYLERGRYLDGKNLYAVKLRGVDNCNAAEALRDYKLLVTQDDRLPLAEDEYHVADLIGMEVYDRHTQDFIGKVVDLYSIGNDLLEIELTEKMSDPNLKSEVNSELKARKVLVPFVKDIVPLVDIDAKRIEIDPPSGLLDISQNS
jgi:16S rRNA processing protein RimM